MNKKDLETEDVRLLNIVREYPEGAKFRQIVSKARANKDRIRERLAFLMKNGLVSTEDGWRHGRTKWHFITEKGKLALLQNDVNSFKKILKEISTLTRGIASDTESVDQWQTMRREASSDLSAYVRAADLPFQEKEQMMLEGNVQIQKEWDRPMLECLRAVHEVFLSTFPGSPAADSLVGIKMVDNAYEVTVERAR